MSDFLTRLREEADRRLDPRDAAALQRELEDHLRASVAAYEEVGHPEPERAAEEGLGEPGRLVRDVARRLRVRRPFREAFRAMLGVGVAVILCLLLGGGGGGFPFLEILHLVVSVASVWHGIRAARRDVWRALAGALVGWCAAYVMILAVVNPMLLDTPKPSRGSWIVAPLLPGMRQTAREGLRKAEADVRLLQSPLPGKRPVRYGEASYGWEFTGESPHLQPEKLTQVSAEMIAHSDQEWRMVEAYDHVRPSGMENRVDFACFLYREAWLPGFQWIFVFAALGKLCSYLPDRRPKRGRRA